MIRSPTPSNASRLAGSYSCLAHLGVAELVVSSDVANIMGCRRNQQKSMLKSNHDGIPIDLTTTVKTTSYQQSSHSDSLRFKMNLCVGEVETAFANNILNIEGTEAADQFTKYLVLMHQIIRASLPLMEEALLVATARKDKDDICKHLIDYFRQHIIDEANHDLWILEDFESAGFDSSLVLRNNPLPNVAAMVGAQYYWIKHAHPLALLGYISFLESYPPSTSLINRLHLKTGLKLSIFRTLSKHGELDPNHREDIWRLIDSLPLSDSDAALMAMSAFHTGKKFADCINHLNMINPVLSRPTN